MGGRPGLCPPWPETLCPLGPRLVCGDCVLLYTVSRDQEVGCGPAYLGQGTAAWRLRGAAVARVENRIGRRMLCLYWAQRLVSSMGRGRGGARHCRPKRQHVIQTTTLARRRHNGWGVFTGSLAGPRGCVRRSDSRLGRPSLWFWGGGSVWVGVLVGGSFGAILVLGGGGGGKLHGKVTASG